MSARAAGRIAAIVTSSRMRGGSTSGGTAELMQMFSPEPRPEPVRTGATAVSRRGSRRSVHMMPPAEPRAAAAPAPEPAFVEVPSGPSSQDREGRTLQSLISYIPGEALVIYLVGVAVVTQIHDPVPTASKATAVWALFVIAFVANAVLMGFAFRDRMRDAGLSTLDIGQVAPFLAGLVVIELTFFVLAAAVPGGIVLFDAQWVPVILLIGGALVIAIAKVFCLSPLAQATED